MARLAGEELLVEGGELALAARGQRVGEEPEALAGARLDERAHQQPLHQPRRAARAPSLGARGADAALRSSTAYGSTGGCPRAMPRRSSSSRTRRKWTSSSSASATRARTTPGEAAERAASESALEAAFISQCA